RTPHAVHDRFDLRRLSRTPAIAAKVTSTSAGVAARLAWCSGWTMFNDHFGHQYLELPPLLCFWLSPRHYALRWRAKCPRPSEIDAIDDRTHPAHEILVTARGWPPGRPAHLTPGAGHPPAAEVGSQLAAIPAQAPIAFLLASAHCSATFRIRAAAIRQPPWRPR